MEYLKIAEDFAIKIWPYKNKFKLEDIMLFGSVAYEKKDPSDLDLLILHKNEILEEFQDVANSKIEDIDKLRELSRRLNKEIDLLALLESTTIEKLIFKNKFNIKYLDIGFFTDHEYKNKWIKRNKELCNLERRKAMLPDETFEECIFRQGLLYNQKTQKYDILSLQKYKL